MSRAYDVSRLLCTDSAKAIKAEKYGYINGILYMAPYSLSGKNLCPNSSVGCRALCLGWTSGQAGMVHNDGDMNATRNSRIVKAQAFMRDRKQFMADLVRAIANLERKAKRLGKKLCVRLNGSTDIGWEMIRHEGKTVFQLFPEVQFVDYTKIAKRFERPLPRNYRLTFSRSETNEAEAIPLLVKGHNVAVVFEQKPEKWNGFVVFDGDQHDLRNLDPNGVVIGLSPKGRKAKRDTSGFVVRAA